MSGWEVAGRRGRRSRPGAGPGSAAGAAAHGHAPCPTPAGDAPAGDGPPGEADAAAVARVESRVRERVEALRGSALLLALEAALAEAWPVAAAAAGEGADAGRMLCLGIGSADASAASASQLALAWLLAERLGLTLRAWADPQMGAADAAAGREFGLEVADPATAPDEGPGTGPVLLYMPHCDRALYERVLAASMAAVEGEEGGRRIGQVVLVGNSFEAYLARDEFSPGVHDGFMHRLRPCFREQALPDFDACVEAFNDLAVITFPAGTNGAIAAEIAAEVGP